MSTTGQDLRDKHRVFYGDGKVQPWKAFWPPRLDAVSEEELKKMPWLTWGPDPDNPDGKPWYDWMMRDTEAALPGVVCRRGAG